MSKLSLQLLVLSIFLSGCASTSNLVDKPLTNAQKSAISNAELGLAYLKKGNMTRAKAKLNRALTVSPDLALVQYSMAYFLEQTGEIKQAERFYQKAIALDRRSGEVHNNYGAFLCRQQRYAEAEREFLLAVQDPAYLGTGRAYENAGFCALENTEYVGAEKYFKLALKHDPNLSRSLLELADLSFDEGNYKEAFSYLSRYQRMANSTPRSLWLGVRVADSLGDSGSYKRYAKLLTKSYPDSPESDMLAEYMKE